MSFMVNFEKKILKFELIKFLNSVYQDSYSFFVVYNSEIIFENKIDTTPVDFHWMIFTQDEPEYDSRTFSEMTIAVEFFEDNSVLTWLHHASIFFNSKIYTEANIDFIPESYYAVWCIDKKQREIFFDNGEGEYKKYYKL